MHIDSFALGKTVEALHDGVASNDCWHKDQREGEGSLHV
jgi:hypothetical protein